MPRSYFFSCIATGATVLTSLLFSHLGPLSKDCETEILAAARRHFDVEEEAVLVLAAPLPAMDDQWAHDFTSMLQPDLVTVRGVRLWWLTPDLDDGDGLAIAS